jgi:hypothetical protein
MDRCVKLSLPLLDLFPLRLLKSLGKCDVGIQGVVFPLLKLVCVCFDYFIPASVRLRGYTTAVSLDMGAI